MAKYKKQHYIPKCYLKAWCDPETPVDHTPYIWTFQKDTKTGKRKAPENIFHASDLYTIWDANGNRDLTIEHGFSGLEKLFSDIRRKKISLRKPLTHEEHFIICIFMAAMHSRIKSQIQNMSSQWKPVMDQMETMMKYMETATEEEREKLASIPNISSSDDSETISYEDVKLMVEKPMETMMIPMIQTEAPLLTKLDFAILYTTDKQGFITSDNPCIWIDPEAYKRPPLYQSPALMYDSIEIIFPISPSQCIVLNKKGLNGYINFDSKNLANTNRIIHNQANELYVSNQNTTNEYWFHRDEEPEDSWNNQHKKSQQTKENQ